MELSSLQLDLAQLFYSVQKQPEDQWVVAGDFNLQQHRWGHTATSETWPALDNLTPLLTVLEGKCVMLIGMITHISAMVQSTIDLTLAGTTTMVTRVQTLHITLKHDHLPILFTMHPPAETKGPAAKSGMGSLTWVKWALFCTTLVIVVLHQRWGADSTAGWSMLLVCLRKALVATPPSICKHGKPGPL